MQTLHEVVGDDQVEREHGEGEPREQSERRALEVCCVEGACGQQQQERTEDEEHQGTEEQVVQKEEERVLCGQVCGE